MSHETSWGLKRSGLYLLIAWTEFPVATLLGLPWSALWCATIIGFFALGLIMVVPRRCAVCRSKTAPTLPVFFNRKLPAWWDLRPGRQRDMTWVCHRHFDIFIEQTILRSLASRTTRENNT